jgi:hypothetical protein
MTCCFFFLAGAEIDWKKLPAEGFFWKKGD